jgi:hypothetical protein
VVYSRPTFIYSDQDIILQKDCNILGPNQIDIFLAVADILAFNFELAAFEVNVTFTNGDVETFVDGPLIVKSGRGPFE